MTITFLPTIKIFHIVQVRTAGWQHNINWLNVKTMRIKHSIVEWIKDKEKSFWRNDIVDGWQACNNKSKTHDWT